MCKMCRIVMLKTAFWGYVGWPAYYINRNCSMCFSKILAYFLINIQRNMYYQTLVARILI